MNKIPMLEQFAVQSLVEHDGELIFSKEKFAELIIDECIAQCWSVSELEHKGYVVSECSKRVRKRFGLEV